MTPIVQLALSMLTLFAHHVIATPHVEFVGMSSHLVARQEASSNHSAFAGYQIYTSDSLVLNNLNDRCEQALTSLVHCDDYTLTFQSNAYRGSLRNDSLTASVCDPGCGKSLKSWFDNVAKACDSGDGTDLPWEYAGGKIWAGYNETCLKDPDSGSYCNDLIAKFPTNMPKVDTCSYCYVHRLSIMQRSQYSEYDAVFQGQLESVNKVCSLSLPTGLPASLYNPPEVTTSPCYTGNTYTTKKGDSCDSIALANKVSSYALFTGNQGQLHTCQAIPSGLKLCIPATCTTYTIKTNETCTDIELDHGMDFSTLHNYNSWIWPDCSNLQSGINNYGRVICIDPQGGAWNETSPVGTPVGNGGSAGAFSYNVTAPPDGSTVAHGTTRNCGVWYVANKTDTCTAIMVRSGVPASLFLRVNPSLHAKTCNSDLVAGRAYCISPTFGWAAPPDTSTGTSSTTKSSSTTSKRSSTRSTSSKHSTTTSRSTSVSPSPSGTPSDCISFYVVEKGDTCPLILLKFLTQLNLADLLAWNLQLGLDCSGLKVGMKLCVGI